MVSGFLIKGIHSCIVLGVSLGAWIVWASYSAILLTSLCLRFRAKAIVFLRSSQTTEYGGVPGSYHDCATWNSCNGQSLLWSSPLYWLRLSDLYCSLKLALPNLHSPPFIFHRHYLLVNLFTPNSVQVSAFWKTQLINRSELKVLWLCLTVAILG